MIEHVPPPSPEDESPPALLFSKVRRALQPVGLCTEATPASTENEESLASQFEHVLRTLFLLALLSGAPLTARLAYATVYVADVLHLLHDPQGRGRVYDQATAAIRASWPENAAEVIIIALDRLEDGRGVSPERLLPKLFAEAYAVPGEYGELLSEWQREDEREALAKEVAGVLQQVVAERLEHRSSTQYQPIMVHPSVQAAAGQIGANNGWFGIADLKLRRSVQERIESALPYYSDPSELEQHISQAEGGAQLAAEVEYFATLPESFLDRYVQFARFAEKHALSEGLRAQLLMMSEFLSLPQHDFEQYEQLFVVFQELDEQGLLDAAGWGVFFRTTDFYAWAHTYSPAELRAQFALYQPAISRMLAHAEVFAQEYPELQVRPELVASALREASERALQAGELHAVQRDLEWRMLRGSEAWGELLSLGSDFNWEEVLSSAYRLSSEPPERLFTRFFNDPYEVEQYELHLLEGLSEGAGELGGQSFEPFVEDLPPVFQAFAQSMLTTRMNRLWDKISGSAFALDAAEARELLVWFLNSPDSNSFSDQDALLFAGVAFQQYRLMGADEETPIAALEAHLAKWGSVFGPHFLAYLNQSEKDGIQVSMQERVHLFRLLFEATDARNVFTDYDRLQEFYPDFQSLSGETFHGVLVEIDVSSLKLHEERFHAQTQLGPGELAFVMPWTYFPSDNPADPVGLIEFAATRSLSGSEYKLLSAETEKTDFSIPENRQKFLFGMTENGVFIEQVARLLDDAETSSEQLIKKLQERGASGGFVPNFFYHQDLPEPLVGFGSRKLSQFFTSLLVVSAQDDGVERIFLLDVKSQNTGVSQKEFGTDYFIDEQDLLGQMQRSVPGRVTHVLFGDPGHSLHLANDGGEYGTRVGLNEADTFRMSAIPAR